MGLTRVGKSLKDKKGQDQSTGVGICFWQKEKEFLHGIKKGRFWVW